VKSHDGETERAKGEFLTSENRDEYTFMKFKKYLFSEAIEHQLSISGRPE